MYSYQYDHLNRLLEGNYKKEGGNFRDSYLEHLSYDKNGNIQSLLRHGDSDANDYEFVIDELEYTYHPENQNQLMKVFDSTNSPQGFKDDTDGIDEDLEDDYEYDANGNLTKDDNKKIDEIKYNHLNLPVLIYFANGSKISYLYNAVGQKVRKVVTSSETTTTDYLADFQYHNGSLKHFPHAEGYVNVVDRKFKYVYNYTDHLGNIRLSYSDANGNNSIEQEEILEENHYYPFGLKHTAYNTNEKKYIKDEVLDKLILTLFPKFAGDGSYNYKYNGKEYQDELGLNVTAMDYRQYDNAIGRFNSIDRLAELAPMWSPFRFAFNNPVYWSDPTGLSEEDGSNGQATCPTCPKTPKFQPYIDDPNNEYFYDSETDTASKVVKFEEVVLTGSVGGGTDWAEYFNNGAGGFGTGLGFLSNQGGYFYLNNASWLTPSNIPGEINIKINYTPKNFRTGNQYTSKPISASKVIAKGTIVVSVLLEVPEVADGFKKSKKEGIKQTAGAAGGIFGGMILGAELGGLLGIETGPGAVITAVIGGVVGASVGEDAVEAIFDNVSNNSSYKGNFSSEPGLNGCFLSGTKILMANGIETTIENIREGDFVMSYNFELTKLEPKKVLEKIEPIHKEIVEIVFSNSIKNSNTFDHPYYVIGKGWSSYYPKETLNNYGMKVEKIEIGDKCYFYDEGNLTELEVISFKTIKGNFSTYN